LAKIVLDNQPFGRSRLGVPRLVVGKILNHAEPGVTKVYDRHSYDKEKREALESWSKRLMVLVSDLQAMQKTEAIETAPDSKINVSKMVHWLFQDRGVVAEGIGIDGLRRLPGANPFLDAGEIAILGSGCHTGPYWIWVHTKVGSEVL
jgi:hypothetical protein